MTPRTALPDERSRPGAGATGSPLAARSAPRAGDSDATGTPAPRASSDSSDSSDARAGAGATADRSTDPSSAVRAAADDGLDPVRPPSAHAGASVTASEVPPGAADLDPALLDGLRERVRAASGLAVTPDNLARALRQRLARCNVDAAAYAARLTPAELQQLLELLVVPESWLFRDPGAFAVAVRAVQARLASGAASARLLVLPCAAGEEAYSLAIALAEAGITPPQWHLDAVDLSTAALARARAGWFGPNAFRGSDLAFRARHFTRDGAGWQIAPPLQRGVQFHHGNLLTWPGVAGGYDVVFCRNLLIYFDEPTASAALARLRALLAPDGVLCAGYAEVPAFCAAGFASLPTPAAFALRHANAPEPAWLGSAKDRRATARGPDRRQPTRRAPRALSTPFTSAVGRSGSSTVTPSPADASGAFAAPAAHRAASLPTPATPAAEGGTGQRSRRLSGSSGAAAAAPRIVQPADAQGGIGDGPGALGAAATGGAGRPSPPPRGLSGTASPSAAARDGSAEHLADTWLTAAQELADRGDLPAAAALCRQVIATAPDTAEAYYLLAMAAAQAADEATARAELRRCLYLQPDHYPCLCQLALLAEQDGDTAAAARLRRRAARVHARETS